jgi:hypothetical protein
MEATAADGPHDDKDTATKQGADNQAANEGMKTPEQEEKELADATVKAAEEIPDDDDDGMTSEELAQSAFGRTASNTQSDTHNRPNAPPGNPKKGNQSTSSKKPLVLEDPRRTTLVATKTYVSGVHLSKIGTNHEIDLYSDELQAIIASVFSVDESALVMPHTRSSTSALGQAQFMKLQDRDFDKFFDITVDQWGHKKEGKWKKSLSFYIASDKIEPNLRALKEAPSVYAILKDLNLRMSPHSLLESSDSQIGFFLGKSQKHTWRDDLCRRLSHHMQIHQYKATHSQQEFPDDTDENAQMPPPIPIAAKPRTISFQDVTAEVITIFVGKRDATTVLNILKDDPLPGVELALHTIKKTHPEEWRKRLLIHNYQVNNSAAVKILDCNARWKKFLEEQKSVDVQANVKILDFERFPSSAPAHTLFAQCHKEDKPWVTTWLQQTLPLFLREKNDTTAEVTPTIALNDMPSTGPSKGPQSNPDHDRIAPSKFDHLMNDPRFLAGQHETPEPNMRNTAGRVPSTITLGRRTTAGVSYAQAATQDDQATAQSENTPDHTSAASTKSLREIQLEEELSAMASKFEETFVALEEAQAANALLKEQLDTVLQNTEERLSEQISKETKAMKEETTVLRQQLQILMDKLGDGIPSPDRKKADHKSTPNVVRAATTNTTTNYDSYNMTSQYNHVQPPPFNHMYPHPPYPMPYGTNHFGANPFFGNPNPTPGQWHTPMKTTPEKTTSPDNSGSPHGTGPRNLHGALQGLAQGVSPAAT